MFGSKKTITDRVKDSLTEYLDEKFDQYRSQIALDLSRGLGALAGLVALWSVAIISGIFSSITLALLIGWALSFLLGSGAYILSFGLLAILLLAGTYYLIKNKKRYIEQPVFDIMAALLRSPEESIYKEEAPIHSESNEPEDIASLPIVENNSTTTPLPSITNEQEQIDKKHHKEP